MRRTRAARQIEGWSGSRRQPSAGSAFLMYALFCGVLAAGVGYETYCLGLGAYLADKSEEEKTTLQLVDVVPDVQAGLRVEEREQAAQALAVIQQAGLDPSKVNPNGGAIALGHPLGCTGAKLTAGIVRELERRNARYGVITMCIGGGMGAAGIVERLS